jgi:hypothetical protein
MAASGICSRTSSTAVSVSALSIRLIPTLLAFPARLAAGSASPA